MTNSMIRTVALACLLAAPFPAIAAELSPWFGSQDQTPFQLDPVTMVSVTFAADPLQTGSTDKIKCLPPGCIPVPGAATNEPVGAGVPQN
jgi:hypothetical protein